jgi:hypothetical protein
MSCIGADGGGVDEIGTSLAFIVISVESLVGVSWLITCRSVDNLIVQYCNVPKDNEVLLEEVYRGYAVLSHTSMLLAHLNMEIAAVM